MTEVAFMAVKNKLDDHYKKMAKMQRQLARRLAISLPAPVIHQLLQYHQKVRPAAACMVFVSPVTAGCAAPNHT
jgi:hypothetical protein